jgi:hypothetical protein
MVNLSYEDALAHSGRSSPGGPPSGGSRADPAREETSGGFAPEVAPPEPAEFDRRSRPAPELT